MMQKYLKPLLASAIVAGLCFFVYHKWSTKRPPEVAQITAGLEDLEAHGLPSLALPVFEHKVHKPLAGKGMPVGRIEKGDSHANLGPQREDVGRSVERPSGTRDRGAIGALPGDREANVRQVNIKEYANGSAVIVNFWASWCEPCAREIPSMLRLKDEFGGRLKIVAISADENLEEAERFIRTFELQSQKDILLLWDNEKKGQRHFGVQRLPESFLFKSDGSFSRKVIGVDQWYTPQSIEFVKLELLSSQ
jgi:thiol-disulfide isomerase/thioredoxin